MAAQSMPLLLLPPDFRLVTFGWTKEPMSRGVPTPPAHDGMAAFDAGDGVPGARLHSAVHAVDLDRHVRTHHGLPVEPCRPEGRDRIARISAIDSLGIFEKRVFEECAFDEVHQFVAEYDILAQEIRDGLAVCPASGHAIAQVDFFTADRRVGQPAFRRLFEFGRRPCPGRAVVVPAGA